MNDPTKNPQGRTMREEGLLRARHRIARLDKLVALNAPMVIAIREAFMVIDALRLADPAAYNDAERDRGLAAHKGGFGFCTEDGCINAVEPTQYNLRDAACPSCLAARITAEEDLDDLGGEA